VRLSCGLAAVLRLLAPLRGEARFQALRREIGLA